MWVGMIEEWKNGYKVLVKRENGRIVNIEYLVSPSGELMRMRGPKKDAKKILSFIEELEFLNIEVVSRYGDHEETKKYLKKVVK